MTRVRPALQIAHRGSLPVPKTQNELVLLSTQSPSLTPHINLQRRDRDILTVHNDGPGHGVTFTLRLPAVNQPVMATGAA
jgi:UPF0288 family protein (methanogenesis marker protein 3)